MQERSPNYELTLEYAPLKKKTVTNVKNAFVQ